MNERTTDENQSLLSGLHIDIRKKARGGVVEVGKRDGRMGLWEAKDG